MTEIWEELRTDREGGAKRLVAEYGNRLYAAAMLLCRNAADAEDLTFRTLEQAIRRIDQYRPTGEFFSWLYMIMRNFRLMDMRRHMPDIVAVGSTIDLPETMDSSLAGKLASIDAETIRTAVRRLPLALAETLVLRFFEGFSMEEISIATEVPVGTVKSRLFSAKAALRELLAELTEGGRQ